MRKKITAIAALAFTLCCSVGAPALAKGKKSKLPTLSFGGYVQAGFRYTANDEYLRVGESDGFFLRKARLKAAAAYGMFDAVLSMDGAYDRHASPSDVTPADRRLYVDLRDAFLRFKTPCGFFIRAGQFKVPFGSLSMVSSADETFLMNSVTTDGEDPAFGRKAYGMGLGRQLGAAVGYSRKIGTIGLYATAMLMNGNGGNHFGNDSDGLGIAAKLNISVGKLVTIGGGFYFNPRTVGEPPNLLDETDLAFEGDIRLTVAGITLEGEFIMRSRSFPTTGQAKDNGLGVRGELSYLLKAIMLRPAVRFEMYDPSSLFDDDRLIYITIGLNWYKQLVGRHHIRAYLSYTIKMEEKDHTKLNNDQLNLILQYRF